jgi:hypothetical protein
MPETQRANKKEKKNQGIRLRLNSAGFDPATLRVLISRDNQLHHESTGMHTPSNLLYMSRT